MKAKQVLSTAFAAAMVFSTLYGTSVMAEEIDSGTIFVDQEVIDVTLPTTASQKFYIDPQGLIAIGKGGSAVANAGTVTGASAMYAVNRSSIPLALSVSYKLIDSAESDGVTVVTVDETNTADKVKEDADKKIAVSVSAVESATDADSNGNTCGGKVFKNDATDGVDITGSTGNLSTADVIYAGTTAVTADYLMTAETYKAQLKAGKTAADAYDSSAYEYVVDTTANKASCVKLTIGGYCSEKADWSDYADGTETLKLDVVFKFNKVTTDEGDYTDAKAGTTEVEVGPKVTITPGGVITISGLTAATDPVDMNLIDTEDGNKAYNLTSQSSTWTATGSAAEGTIVVRLGQAWYGLANKQVKIELDLKDGSKISGTTTLGTEPSAN